MFLEDAIDVYYVDFYYIYSKTYSFFEDTFSKTCKINIKKNNVYYISCNFSVEPDVRMPVCRIIANHKVSFDELKKFVDIETFNKDDDFEYYCNKATYKDDDGDQKIYMSYDENDNNNNNDSDSDDNNNDNNDSDE